ncbi:type I methionyl aminopeptidase [Salisediminibacterium selenitireducens]|uniref:Methionine aminopeptidase n=1 Tax=Bacillus selenitireducens (strain ATCC 700615 / DSM 15326 / MLS10) TaxID=439292 RepID=D6XX45_BACIE|nr:type I methionyl aminopeptidase [Salisediminibacterium selenitireducens]ADI00022.1 methionine aminopeptidase, type I [[Bacillus] selenitireducens MLS10]
MIERKSAREVEKMIQAGELVAQIHRDLRKLVKPGVTTAELDRFVEKEMKQAGATPAQKGYQGYEFATCASVNDEICHGFPRKASLKEGDIVTVDFVLDYEGGLADSAWTYEIGEVSREIRQLNDVTKEALYRGIRAAKAGNRTGDIGAAIQNFVEPFGYGIVREFAGHGIGPTIHEEPNIPHYGQSGRGIRLKEGMAITIEPMINTGGWRAKMDSNGWTARTRDGSLSTQFEHTLIITDGEPIITTEQDA